MPAKPARKIVGKSPSRKAPRKASRKLTAVRAGSAAAAAPTAAPATPLLGAGWGDLYSPALRQNVDLGAARHLAMRVKVIDAGTAQWIAVGRVSSGLAGLPDTMRKALPCVVRDASAGKTYPALASVASNGTIAITEIAASADGSFQPPFAIGLGDEVHITFVYAL